MNYYFSEEYQDKRKQMNAEIFAFCDLSKPTDIKKLTDGYIVKKYYYADTLNQKEGYAPVDGELCRLYKNDVCIFEWKNIDGHSRMSKIIKHSNGKSYLLFDEDLYGYSVLDIETGSCVHYFPAESYFHDMETFEETFIWFEPYYDTESNLLAVEGCYWACPYSVIVADFTDPMKIAEASDWYDLMKHTKYQEIIDDDIEFKEWDKNFLICSSVSISKQEILQKIGGI